MERWKNTIVPGEDAHLQILALAARHKARAVRLNLCRAQP